MDDRDAQRSHKELLLGMIDGLCRQAQILPRALQGIGCGAGPGSFTGVRIGVAAAQALAFAADCAVAMINSLDALALATVVPTSLGDEPQPSDAVTASLDQCSLALLCARRSRASAYYLAAYPLHSETRTAVPPLQRTAMTLCEDAAGFHAWRMAQSQLGNATLVLAGERPPWLPSAECADWGGAPIPMTAAASMALTVNAFATGASAPAEQALPVYLPEDSPWRPSSYTKRV